MENKDTAFASDSKQIGSKVKPVPKPKKNIGVDTDNTIVKDIVDLADSSQLDVSGIESFSSVARTRDQIYTMLDTMSEDSKVSAILATFAADATETNEAGKIVWAESSDDNVAKYVNYLLDTINVDKNVYKWLYSLCKYGDLYIRRYRESETRDILSDDLSDRKLNEEVKVVAYPDTDRFVDYVEMVANPAEVFELTKFGKTYAYIQSKLSTTQTKEQMQYAQYYRYKFTKGDVEVFQPTMFVHATLDDNPSRSPEEVQIFRDDNYDENTSSTFKVKKGQSILYDKFKLWRELTLLENSLLLSRVTKASLIRVIKMNVGDMSKEDVTATLNRLKSLIEQKMALKDGKEMSEYTSPGPMENIIYLPIRGELGNISQDTLGGNDVDVKGIADIEYYQSMFYGAFGIPKQYFGATNDNTGFNGGTSLTIISASYAKKVKRIQNAVCQALTDLINLMLLDKKLNNYINSFEIKMQSPITQEDLDRKESVSGRVQIMNDILNALDDIEDPVYRLRIARAMLSNILSDSEVIDIIQEYIDDQSKPEEEQPPEPTLEGDNEEESSPGERGAGFSALNREMSSETAEEPETSDIELPNARDLGVDFTQGEEEI